MTSALGSREFRLLWASQSVSVLGDGLIVVAIGLYVTRLTGDPTDVGIVLAAYTLPLVAFLSLGGVVADRLARQRVMVASDTVRAVLHGTLAVLIVTGSVRIWQMTVIGLLFGTAQAFFQPAYTGLIPATVPEEAIQSAQALGGISREVATFVGPALATALVFGVGGGAAFGLDSATFVVSALTLTRVRPRRRGAAHVRSTVRAELREGWAAVRSRAWVWVTIVAFSTSILVALAPFFVLGPAVAQQVYGTPRVYGYTNAAWGIGTVLGVALGARWRPRRPMLTGTLLAVAWPAQITLFALGPPRSVLYLLTVLAGLGLGSFGVWWETALAQRIPPRLLSRVSAWDWMGSLALMPVGYLLAGPTAAVLGDVDVLVAGGLIGMTAMALAAVPSATRSLRRLEPAPVPAVVPGT